jgi:hypothetical protein
MKQLTRITLNPEVMGGKPCIRGLRVTVGTIVGLMASGHSPFNLAVEKASYLLLKMLHHAETGFFQKTRFLFDR